MKKPLISIPYDACNTENNPLYLEVIHRVMRYVVPEHFFTGKDIGARFHAELPIFSWTPLETAPINVSFFLCCFFRPNAFRFFCEMLTRWSIPGKRMNALLQFAAEFSIKDLGENRYIAGEVVLHIENQRDLETLRNNLPIIESEIRLGVESHYQACRILEIKGLSADEKTAVIQENIIALVKHRPQDFDYDILSEMQHFLVLCKEDFKAARDYKHMSRIICIHYLFRKSLRYSLEAYPNKRFINIKLVRARIEESKRVLGISLGISFLRDNELFEARHILNGVRNLIPDVQIVENSFFINRSRSDPTIMFYLEIEKENGELFSLEEMKLLKSELPTELKNRIESRLNPIFMPQNEEEIMRHILTLSNQLKYVRDLPQSIIAFNQQTEEKLEFLVILLRVGKPKLRSIASCFEGRPTFLEFIADRIKYVGTLRKRYRKEANVFRVRIRKAPFLRQDQSVDLYKARQEVVNELARLTGEFRDYNGGMISKETELFNHLRKSLGKQGRDNAFLLENFFFSLSPAVMRSVLPPEPLKRIFLMLLEAEPEEAQPFCFKVEEEPNYFFIFVMAVDPSFRRSLESSIDRLAVPSLQLAQVFVLHNDMACFGVIYRNPEPVPMQQLQLTAEKVMTEWGERFALTESKL